jgi:hypothetical protein
MSQTDTWHVQWSVASAGGRLQFLRREAQPSNLAAAGRKNEATVDDAIFDLSPTLGSMSDARDRWWKFGGVEYFDRPLHSFQNGNTSGWLWGFRYVTLPWRLVTLGTAVLPAGGFVYLWRWRRARRWARDNLCRTCGYDLRASTERCPECGSAVPGGVVSSGS